MADFFVFTPGNPRFKPIVIRTMQKVTFHTLGCKLNFAETSTLGRQFIDRGFAEVDNESRADVIVINTCSVTERADQKARQVIRHLQKNSPDAFTIVTGCYAQLDPEEIAGIEGVDLVLGSSEKFKLFDYIQSFERSGAARVFTTPIEEAHEFGGAYSLEVGNRTRVFLKIQDGCDYVCTYCTIPQARGESRSPSVEFVLGQARELAEKGVKEIVLAGVNIGDFGKNSDRKFIDLCKALDQVDGIERIRISSIEPNLITDEIIEFVSGSRRFCHHFHIPMQSGSDAVLKLMKRRYLTTLYRERVEKIRALIPDAGIGADMIVGFPGETDALFDETAEFVASLPLTYLHAFTFSERENTPAWSMPGTVPHHTRKKRNAHLRIISRKKEHEFLERFLNRNCEILVEGDVQDGLNFGYTGNYVRIGIPNAGHLENTLQKVTVTGWFSDNELRGEQVI